MPRRRKEPPPQLRKLPSYYSNSARPHQNGTRPENGTDKTAATASPPRHSGTDPGNLPSGSSLAASTPTTRSPVKSRQRTASPHEIRLQHSREVSAHNPSLQQASEVPDPIAGFPTSGQPVSDTVLKDMLMSLRSSLHHDMLHTVKQCQAEVQRVREGKSN